MKCPMCSKWSNVIETRGDRRRRECGNGHRFTTREVVWGDAVEQALRIREARRILKAKGYLRD